MPSGMVGPYSAYLCGKKYCRLCDEFVDKKEVPESHCKKCGMTYRLRPRKKKTGKFLVDLKLAEMINRWQ